MCIHIYIYSNSQGRPWVGSEFVGPIVGLPVASGPGACPPLAYLIHYYYYY